MGDTQPDASTSQKPSEPEPAAPPATVALIIGADACPLYSEVILPDIFSFWPLKLVIHAGMAGSGKTSLVQRISQHIQASKAENFVMNLDPAVHSLPYHANVDIRDTVRFC